APRSSPGGKVEYIGAGGVSMGNRPVEASVKETVEMEVRMVGRRMIPLLALVMFASGCAGSPHAGNRPGGERRARSIYAAVIGYMAGLENGFGPLLVGDRACAGVGDPMGRAAVHCADALTARDRAFIRARL